VPPIWKEFAMAREEDDDLYDEEFDFVDDDDDEEFDEEDASDIADESSADEEAVEEPETADDLDEEPVDEYGRPEPKADYVVHIYEHQHFKRTIDRPFTPEDAEAFATEYNRTSKSYGRTAVTSKNDAKPKKSLD
jgi:hypothetical protein